MKRQSKTLKLNRETIRLLTLDRLAIAAGFPFTIGWPCWPDTAFMTVVSCFQPCE